MRDLAATDPDAKARRVVGVEFGDPAVHGLGADEGARDALRVRDHQPVSNAKHLAPPGLGDGGPERGEEAGAELVEGVVAEAGSARRRGHEVTKENRHGLRVRHRRESSRGAVPRADANERDGPARRAPWQVPPSPPPTQPACCSRASTCGTMAGVSRTDRRTGAPVAVALWARREVRARWRSLVVLGVLAGLAAGVALAAVAGARRTSSAYARYRHATDVPDAILFGTQVGRLDADYSPVIRLPEVVDAGRFTLSPVMLDGKVGGLPPGDDHLYRTISRPLLVVGRQPRTRPCRRGGRQPACRQAAPLPRGRPRHDPIEHRHQRLLRPGAARRADAAGDGRGHRRLDDGPSLSAGRARVRGAVRVPARPPRGATSTESRRSAGAGHRRRPLPRKGRIAAPHPRHPGPEPRGRQQAGHPCHRPRADGPAALRRRGGTRRPRPHRPGAHAHGLRHGRRQPRAAGTRAHPP